MTTANKPSGSTQGSVIMDQGSRRGSAYQGSMVSRTQPRYECTYKMTPDRRFPSHEARGIIEGVLREGLGDRRYDPEKSRGWCRDLADKIKSRVKDLGYFRYKIVALVTIGSLEHGTICCASRCIWNDASDTYGEYTYRNGSLYAIGMAYGVYQE